MKPIFTGSCVALITPFENSKVDYSSLEKLIEFQISNGTSAILICGTTGEPSTMDYDEEQKLIEFAIRKIAKRVKVIVGTGSNDTKCAVHYSMTAEKLGADALLVVTPYYNKCTQNGLIAHYNSVADNVKTPIILYNVPSRTGVNILPSTALQLSKHQNIVAIKEASGNIEQIVELSSLVQDKLTIYSGDDAITVPMMAMGAKGVISVAANIIPNSIASMCKLYLDGKIEKASEMQKQLYELCKSMFIEVNPIPVKTAAAMMGLCKEELRLPLCKMEDSNKQKLTAILKKYELIK